MRDKLATVLYIPHGSDERLQTKIIQYKRTLFISHMVQMKVLLLDVKSSEKRLYIPHGSDESFFSVIYQKIKFFLYIPHGSDERKNKVGCQVLPYFFISHMVQMKDNRRTEQKNNYLWLYIPHGSDESWSVARLQS